MPKQTSLLAPLAFCLVALVAAKAHANPIFVQNGSAEIAGVGGALGKASAALVGARGEFDPAPSGYERAFSTAAVGLPKAGSPEGLYDGSAVAGSPVRSLAAGAAAGGQPFPLVDGTLSKQVAVAEPATLTMLAMAAAFYAGFKLWRPRRA